LVGLHQHDLLPGCLQLDFKLNAGRKFYTCQSLSSFCCGLNNVDQTLMGATLELLAAILILMNSAQNGNDLFLGGERDRTGYNRAGSLGGLQDLLSSLIHQGGIVALDSDSDFFSHFLFASFLNLTFGFRDFDGKFFNTHPGVSPRG
jgi:hypothetical protein